MAATAPSGSPFLRASAAVMAVFDAFDAAMTITPDAQPQKRNCLDKIRIIINNIQIYKIQSLASASRGGSCNNLKRSRITTLARIRKEREFFYFFRQ